MLRLDIGLVPGTDRLISHVSVQFPGDLIQFFFTGDGIERLQGILRVVKDIIDKVKILFQLLKMTDLVKGASAPQPASSAAAWPAGSASRIAASRDACPIGT